jgi:ABC-2 type transport system permease protein
MSTATVNPPPSTTSRANPLEPVLRSARAELLRLRKWPAIWVIVGAWLTMNAMFSYIFGYVTYTSGQNNFSNEGQTKAELLVTLLPADLANQLPQGMPLFGGAIMMVLGAIVAGNGYGWGTWKTVLTQGPSRSSTLAGSLAAMTTFVAGILAATLLSDALMSFAVALGEGKSTALPPAGDLLASVGVGFVVMVTWAMAGYLLGTLARGPAVPVGLGLVWGLVIENLLRGVGSSLSWIESFTHVLPGTAAGSLVGQLIGIDPGPDATPGLLDTIGFDQALITVLVYAIGLPLITWWLVRRRDVV